ncbi:hypothetical protein [Salinivibrio costicola]|uniref:Uncharacterized protein n=1 Tax=Salinivibrio costicola TaxID=51367 RepID=A0ABX6K205_SALCS|nr:hypothetical protein [Salinivibrio costicola]QIR04959.1 hypothetical protein HBA18_00345 [Salinivibrio costicola]
MNSRHPFPRVPRAHPARRGFTAPDNFYPTWQARANVTARNKDCHFLDKKQSTREYLEQKSHKPTIAYDMQFVANNTKASFLSRLR